VQGIVFGFLDKKTPDKKKSDKVKQFEQKYEKGFREEYEAVVLLVKEGVITSTTLSKPDSNKN